MAMHRAIGGGDAFTLPHMKSMDMQQRDGSRELSSMQQVVGKTTLIDQKRPNLLRHN